MIITDIYSGVFGWYLLGPLLGPTLGPLFGGITVQYLGWRWIFWILTIVCSFNTIIGFFFLQETYAPVILEARKDLYQRDSDDGTNFRMAGQDDRPFKTKLASSMARPLRILFTQPIVLTMAVYQAILFGTTYSLYTNFQSIHGGIYGFNTTQVGLMYIGPGLGFMIAVWFIVPKIDTVYNTLGRKNNGEAKPEFRLPLANIGAVFILTILVRMDNRVQSPLDHPPPLNSLLRNRTNHHPQHLPELLHRLFLQIRSISHRCWRRLQEYSRRRSPAWGVPTIRKSGLWMGR